MYSKSLGNYEILDRLGSGSYGSVYKARHKKTLHTYAIKVIDIGRLVSNNILIPIEYIEREVTVLKKLSHPNIVGLTEYVVEGDQHILAMEYCPGPTLDQYITKRKLSEDGVRIIFKQLAAGLKYMWTKNIIHRDLKPQNILFTSDNDSAQLKIIDFGFSQIRSSSNLMTSIVGTPIYMAPEILLNRPYSSKSDLWSVGCILFEVLAGVAPFAHAMSHPDLARLHATWTRPVLPAHVRVSPLCADLLAKLMHADPVLRMDWNEFFTHPFICNADNMAKSTIPVHIAPMCRTVTLNTQDLDPSCLVSVMKAHLLTDGSADAERYDGVAALLEGKDGRRVEMLDHQSVSTYKDQLLSASVLYLVLPLNTDKDSIQDTAGIVLSSVLANETSDANTSSGSINTDTTNSSTSSASSNGSEDSASDGTNNELATLHSDFTLLAEQLRDNARRCREAYDTCGTYLECREVQVNALKASMEILERHRNELLELSISFKKIYKEPMEKEIKSLPAKVEHNIEELRKMVVDSMLPGLQGRNMLDCVGEAEIRLALRKCIDTIIESGRLVDSCDASLENSLLESKALDSIQRELDHTKRDWEAMRTKLQLVEAMTEAVERWVVKVDEHLSSATSWLGFSFEDPIREGLAHSRAHAATAQAATREVRRLARAIGSRKEMWPVLVGEFCTVANARVQVFSAFRSLHVCGAQSYHPQQRTIEELQRLPEITRRVADQAAQVLLARQSFEKNSQNVARVADESAQALRNGVLDLMKGFHHKLEKQPFAKRFVEAVDGLTPAPIRISLHSPDAVHVHSALLTANQQNAQLRDDVRTRSNEATAMREHVRILNTQLAQARAKEREQEEIIRSLMEKLRLQQAQR